MATRKARPTRNGKATVGKTADREALSSNSRLCILPKLHSLEEDARAVQSQSRTDNICTPVTKQRPHSLPQYLKGYLGAHAPAHAAGRRATAPRSRASCCGRRRASSRRTNGPEPRRRRARRRRASRRPSSGAYGSRWATCTCQHLHARIITVAHAGASCHRGRQATVDELRFFYWLPLDDWAALFLKPCHNRGHFRLPGAVPRPLGATFSEPTGTERHVRLLHQDAPRPKSTTRTQGGARRCGVRHAESVPTLYQGPLHMTGFPRALLCQGHGWRPTALLLRLRNSPRCTEGRTQALPCPRPRRGNSRRCS
jgi:hypothetical protein